MSFANTEFFGTYTAIYYFVTSK